MEPSISATLRDQTLSLLASGTVTSRADLIEALQVAPSTVTSVVRRLLEEGVILEEGVGRSTGGRRPRILRLRETKGILAVAELGGRHARVGLCAPDGGLRTTEEVAIDIAAGPAQVFEVVGATVDRLQAATAPGQELLGVGVALPGPVEFPGGRLIGPARMPGWSGVDASARLAERFPVPVVVDNDAKAAAIGEYVTRRDEVGDMIYVKAGTGIGACLVSGGQIYRGGRGLSGDVTHVRVADSGERECSCGSRGCLETVASGAALARQLAEQGSSATTIREIMAAVSDADPTVVTMVRHAGRLLGVALSGLVNFLNPDAVVIGGALSSLDVYVAATRGMLYERCLPSVTQSLTIQASVAGPDAALVGLGHLLRTTTDVRPS
ncbi:Sugar kinase of the NBD/HSP70 family, may contain an N-terminal HTH domain [Micromonospora coriariae]|uniref:Sugar kinase of the NBD/HSP70 family, may contain an N-terminal HTH domain n=1 Tax=Micromonospora coriariae TaxID=285665 RepID=A0A1C4Y8J5_9ACTN|nr:ROK family transcriptional regulator [Micromonospora coriariae]SCF16966.1 Sugar kinase of the NBD/HSP70 family, may contain an N-terminal HTH domain [Micromonospora coriariae]